jgi:threonylcarbamoyladenosine tRNA methylthiotransferase MtaB
VLTENDNSGHTEHYAPVRMLHPVAPGQIVRARVISAAVDHLLMDAA